MYKKLYYILITIQWRSTKTSNNQGSLNVVNKYITKWENLCKIYLVLVKMVVVKK